MKSKATRTGWPLRLPRRASPLPGAISACLVVGLAAALTAMCNQFVAEITGLGRDFASLRQGLAASAIRDVQAQTATRSYSRSYVDDTDQSSTDDTGQRQQKGGIELSVMEFTPLSIRYTPLCVNCSQGER